MLHYHNSKNEQVDDCMLLALGPSQFLRYTLYTMTYLYEFYGLDVDYTVSSQNISV